MKSIPQQLLTDPSIVAHLKEQILDYAKRIEDLEKKREKYIAEKEYGDNGEISEYFHEQVFDQIKEGRVLPFLKKALNSMCYELRLSQNKIPNQSAWKNAYEKATQHIRIEDTITHFLTIPPDKLKRNISCPFHIDKTPSFKVYPKTNRYKCFSCNTSGSPVDFVMKLKNCSFKESVHTLSSCF